MRKGKKIIGNDVLTYVDARKVHSVKDLLIGKDNETIVALLVSEGGLFSKAEVVPMSNVVSFGKDAVIISDSDAVIPADNFPAVKEILDHDDKLLGKKVFTEGGDEVGSISDLYFEESSGQIRGFEVSGGLVNDVAKGSSYLPVGDIINVGEGVILIKSEAVYRLDEQVGGVRGALDTAKGKVGEAAEATKERVGELRADIQHRAEDAAIGKRAGRDVEADDGSIIVAAGQRIGQEDVELARSKGKLSDLLAAAGTAQVGAAGARAGDTLDKTGERVGLAAEGAADSAGSMWDNLVRKISNMTDAAGRRVDEEQTKKRLSNIHDAVGRPVTKVILDREDNVILNLGDIITHSAVQRAYEAGMLDTLLDSVYKGDVQFSREEMMAPEEGAATVEKASGGAVVVDQMEQKVEQAEQEREQERERKRQEAEMERQQREQERQQREQEREQRQADIEQRQQSAGQSEEDSGGEGAASRTVYTPAGDADRPTTGTTEPHEQASISDTEFERSSKAKS